MRTSRNLRFQNYLLKLLMILGIAYQCLHLLFQIVGPNLVIEKLR